MSKELETHEILEYYNSREIYFQPYQKWRNDGLKAIRGELEKERDVIVVSWLAADWYKIQWSRVLGRVVMTTGLEGLDKWSASMLYRGPILLTDSSSISASLAMTIVHQLTELPIL